MKREIQWRRCGADLKLDRADAGEFPHLVMTHETPLIRPLSGLEHQLQLNKVTNLRRADPTVRQRRDLRVAGPGPADREPDGHGIPAGVGVDGDPSRG